MRTTSRSERHIEKINDFLDNTSQSSLGLLLYSGEINRLKRMFPEILIEEGEHYNNSPLIHCTILRKD